MISTYIILFLFLRQMICIGYLIVKLGVIKETKGYLLGQSTVAVMLAYVLWEMYS